jgi:hypothetical protein
MKYTTSSGKVVDLVQTIIFRVPESLQDEATELIHERGYTMTEIGKEGIRSFSEKEGLMKRKSITAKATSIMEGV